MVRVFILFLFFIPLLFTEASSKYDIYLAKKSEAEATVNSTNIPPSDLFRSVNGNLTEAAKTFFKISYDQKNIYIKVHCEENDLKNIKSVIKEHDGHVFTDDCVELFIIPAKKGNDYFQFVSNSEGVKFEAKKQNGKFTKEWDGDWKVIPNKGNDFWELNIIISLKSLNAGEIKPGDEWKINICRERYCGGRFELYTWAYTKNFHDASKFGTLVFDDLSVKLRRDFNSVADNINKWRKQIKASLKKEDNYLNKFKNLEGIYNTINDALQKKNITLSGFISLKTSLDLLPAEYETLAWDIEIEKLFK